MQANLLTLNIGLNVGVDDKNSFFTTLMTTVVAFEAEGIRLNNRVYNVQESNTEETLVLRCLVEADETLDAPPSIIRIKSAIQKAAIKLNQEAIAFMYNGVGDMVYTNAEARVKWGEFNPEYFIE